MSKFIYYTPTRVTFAKGAELEVGTELKHFGATKVLIHYGSQRVVRTGLMKTVTDAISQAGIEYVKLGGVVPNPRLSTVYEGIELARKEKIDFILAVGGGSVIDSAKAIAVGLCYDGDVWDFFERKAAPTSAVSTGCILTIPAAGSEMSDGMVITKAEGGLKRDLARDFCICKFALLNPELTLTLPDDQTVNGVVDILMHTMERYFHPNEDLDITDSIAEGLLVSVMQSARTLKKDLLNMPARESIMWAGALAHNNLTGCGSGGGDWSTHQIEHEVSGMFDVAHGAGLSVVWPSWARYAMSNIPHRFTKFAHRVMKITPTGDDFADALAGIKAMEDFFREIGSPVNFRELLGREVTEAQIDEMAQKGTYYAKRTLGSARILETDDIAKILTAAK